MKLCTMRWTWLGYKQTSLIREVCLVPVASSHCTDVVYSATFVIELRWRTVRSEIPYIGILDYDSEHVDEEHGLVGQQSRWGQSLVLLLRSLHNRVQSEEHAMAIRKRTAKDRRARFQMEVRRNELDEMELLCKLGNLSSKKELLNTALTLLRWAVRESQRGFSIVSVDQHGQIRSEPYIQYLETIGKAGGRQLRMVHPQSSGGSNGEVVENGMEGAALESEQGEISAAALG